MGNDPLTPPTLGDAGCSVIEALLEIPPSSNNMFFTLKTGARAKTSQYKEWAKVADIMLRLAYNKAGKPVWPAKTPMVLEVRLGLTTRRRDQSNCLKAIEDAVCRLPVPDDRYFDRHLIERDPSLDGMARVRLYPLEAA